MGELRSLNSTRDEMLKTLMAAPEDAVIVVMVDLPSEQNTRVMWTSAAPRTFAYFSLLLTQFAQTFVRNSFEKK